MVVFPIAQAGCRAPAEKRGFPWLTASRSLLFFGNISENSKKLTPVDSLQKQAGRRRYISA
jgi:hypothetical protein